MAQHLVVSCFIMRMPESAISKLVREVGEKWEDRHAYIHADDIRESSGQSSTCAQ